MNKGFVGYALYRGEMYAVVVYDGKYCVETRGIGEAWSTDAHPENSSLRVINMDEQGGRATIDAALAWAVSDPWKRWYPRPGSALWNKAQSG